MKNFLLLGFIVSLVLSPLVCAKESLLPSSTVVVDTGRIDTNVLLASPGGEMFIEFSDYVHFVHEEGGISFTGEIMPPAIIELNVPSPKLRMEEMLSFELISNTGEHVIFADKFDKMYARNRIRERVMNPDEATRSAWVKLIMPIEDPKVGRPELWEFISEDEGWALIGGITGSESPEGVRLFSVVLRRTGVYAVFDASPPPRHYADEFDGSQLSEAALWDEAGIDIPEGLTEEELRQWLESSEYYEYESNKTITEFGFEGVPEADISVADRSITTDDKIALEARKIQLISQVSRETDPERIKMIRELLELIGRKILIADQREGLLAREAQLEAAIPTAATEKLAADLTDQLAIVRAQLAGLEDVELNKRMIELETSINGGSEQRVQEVVVEEQEAPEVVEVVEDEVEIPMDAELPKSGADGGEGADSPSMVFPIVLFGVLAVIVGSMVMATRRREW